jgi:hypothetical protein
MYAVGLLTGFYGAGWTIYPPYLVNANLLWLIIAVSIMNIFPAASLGKVHTGRLWFHHYVYGFLVLGLAAALLLMLSSVPILDLLTGNITDVYVNVGRFFVLGGLTLLLDDLPDVSKSTHAVIRKLKKQAYRGRKIIHAVECFMGFSSIYVFLCVSLYMVENPALVTLANLILAGTLLVTGVFSFAVVKRKIWLNLKLN